MPTVSVNVTRDVIKKDELCSLGSNKGAINSARGSWVGFSQKLFYGELWNGIGIYGEMGAKWKLGKYALVCNTGKVKGLRKDWMLKKGRQFSVGSILNTICTYNNTCYRNGA